MKEHSQLSENMWKKILNFSEECVVVQSSQDLVFMNKAAAQSLRPMSHESSFETPLESALWQLILKQKEELFRLSNRNKETLVHEQEFIDETGQSVVMEVATQKFEDEEVKQKEFDSIFVTYFKELENQKELKKRLLASEKAVQVRDEFISIASHELKNKLNTLVMRLQLSQELMGKNISHFQSRDESSTHDFLHEIKNQIEESNRFAFGLSKLIDELWDSTALRNGKIKLKVQNVDLEKLVQEVVGQIFLKKNELPQISVVCEKKIIGKWDSLRLEQVFSNILMNAIKYGQKKPIYVHLDSIDSGKKALFSCRDEGIGISASMQSKIFERYERASHLSTVSGLGLGLYISKEIIEAHGGEILVHSELGKGTLFTVLLPLDQN